MFVLPAVCKKCLSPGGQTKEDTILTNGLTKCFKYIDIKMQLLRQTCIYSGVSL